MCAEGARKIFRDDYQLQNPFLLVFSYYKNYLIRKSQKTNKFIDFRFEKKVCLGATYNPERGSALR